MNSYLFSISPLIYMYIVYSNSYVLQLYVKYILTYVKYILTSINA